MSLTVIAAQRIHGLISKIEMKGDVVAEIIYASYVSRGDRFEHSAKLPGDQQNRDFVCEVLSEPDLYIDHHYQRKVRLLCRTTDPATGRVREGSMLLPESERLTLVQTTHGV